MSTRGGIPTDGLLDPPVEESGGLAWTLHNLDDGTLTDLNSRYNSGSSSLGTTSDIAVTGKCQLTNSSNTKPVGWILDIGTPPDSLESPALLVEMTWASIMHGGGDTGPWVGIMDADSDYSVEGTLRHHGQGAAVQYDGANYSCLVTACNGNGDASDDTPTTAVKARVTFFLDEDDAPHMAEIKLYDSSDNLLVASGQRAVPASWAAPSNVLLIAGITNAGTSGADVQDLQVRSAWFAQPSS